MVKLDLKEIFKLCSNSVLGANRQTDSSSPFSELVFSNVRASENNVLCYFVGVCPHFNEMIQSQKTGHTRIRFSNLTNIDLELSAECAAEYLVILGLRKSPRARKFCGRRDELSASEATHGIETKVPHCTLTFESRKGRKPSNSGFRILAEGREEIKFSDE